MEGVEGYFDHRDVPGSNKIGPVLHDEEVCPLAALASAAQPCPEIEVWSTVQPWLCGPCTCSYFIVC